MPDIYNYEALDTPKTIILSDPTRLRVTSVFKLRPFSIGDGMYIPYVTGYNMTKHGPNLARLAAKRAAEDKARIQSELN